MDSTLSGLVATVGFQRLDVDVGGAKFRPAICRILAFRGGKSKGQILHSAVNVASKGFRGVYSEWRNMAITRCGQQDLNPELVRTR